MTGEVLLAARDLRVHFPVLKGAVLPRRAGALRAVDGVSFDIYVGETLGLVGESGCGKSTLGRALVQLVRPTSGSVRFAGTELTSLPERALRRLRRRMQMIFQDAYASLSPRMTIERIVAEPLAIHGVGTSKSRRQRVRELLEVVGLDAEHATRYPHEFSGGQRQRINIARALALEPDLIVCDEPLSALDVSIQAQILNLLQTLQERYRLTLLFISHDLAVVRHLCTRVAVMYLGHLVEVGTREAIYAEPLHPYTQALLTAVPVADPERERVRKQVLLRGELPSPIDPPQGCRFSTRCPAALEVRRVQGIDCGEVAPPLLEVTPGHLVACHLHTQAAPPAVSAYALTKGFAQASNAVPRSPAPASAGTPVEKRTLLDVRGLTVELRTPRGVVRAVNDVSFTVGEGETVGIVGESGSGKSVTALALMRLLPTPAGRIVGGEAPFSGADLLGADPRALRRIRGRELAMVFQDPMTSLDPVFTIGQQIIEGLQAHMGLSAGLARRRAIELLETVGISDPARRIDDYPHHLSGGMRQRAMIAMALACEPRLLIADEPTTALDVTVQAQLINLMRDLRRDRRMAIIWISHDLATIAGLADRVLIMYAGRIVERAPVTRLYRRARHPYTRGLLGALPRVDDRRPERLQAIEGSPPNLISYPSGCPFHPRCAYRVAQCVKKLPSLESLDTDHDVACLRATELELSPHGVASRWRETDDRP